MVGKNHFVVHNSCNKLIHTIGAAKHNLQVLVDKFGSPEAALDAVTEAAQDLVKSGLDAHTLKKGVNINVGGIDVTVRGVIRNGEFKICTFYIP